MRTTPLVFVLAGLFFPALGSAGRGGRGSILVFAAFASPRQVVVEGRVIEDQGIRSADPGRSGIGNLVDSVKTFESDEIEGVELRLTVDGRVFSLITDDDGCFHLVVQELSRPLTAGRRPLIIEAMASRGFFIPRFEATLPVLPADAVAVISDFDDTVAESKVTDKKRMLVRTLTRNAAQMQAVPGAAEAYQAALVAGAVEVFYVSGSPQNLYSRITEFLLRQEIPIGPLLLKNFGADPLTEQEGYKLRRIDQLLETMPGVRFLLVGDSGEKDPEVYREVTRRYPERVIGSVIRQVEGGDNSPVRLDGMHGVVDYSQARDLLAELIGRALGGAP